MRRLITPLLLTCSLYAVGCTNDFDEFRTTPDIPDIGLDASMTADTGNTTGGGEDMPATEPDMEGPQPDMMMPVDMEEPQPDMMPPVDMGDPMPDMMPPVDMNMGVDMAMDMMMPPVDMGPPPLCANQFDINCCGNGVLEQGEVCDGFSCGTGMCDDGDLCTTQTQTGTAETCDLVCGMPVAITACTGGDGCCAPGCNPGTDTDCADNPEYPQFWPMTQVQYEDDLVTRLITLRASGGLCGNTNRPANANAISKDPVMTKAGRYLALDAMAKQDFRIDSMEAVDAITKAGYSGESYVLSLTSPTSNSAFNTIQTSGNTSAFCDNLFDNKWTKIGVGNVFRSPRPIEENMTMVFFGK